MPNMAKKKPRRKRKYKTEDLLADFHRLPEKDRLLLLRRLEERLRRAGKLLLLIVVISYLLKSLALSAILGS